MSLSIFKPEVVELFASEDQSLLFRWTNILNFSKEVGLYLEGVIEVV
jgi:hypothetical protein